VILSIPFLSDFYLGENTFLRFNKRAAKSEVYGEKLIDPTHLALALDRLVLQNILMGTKRPRV